MSPKDVETMKSEEGKMWVVDKRMIMAIENKTARRVFGEIWDSMDPESQNQIGHVNLEALIADGTREHTIWQALLHLERANYIRKPSGSRSWAIVYVNPAVVHPFHLKGQKLEDQSNAFSPVEFLTKGDTP